MQDAPFAAGNISHSFLHCQRVVLNAIAGDFGSEFGVAVSRPAGNVLCYSSDSQPELVHCASQVPPPQRCSTNLGSAFNGYQSLCEYSGCDESFAECDFEGAERHPYVPPMGRCITGTLDVRCAGLADGLELGDGTWCRRGRRVHACPRAPLPFLENVSETTTSQREMLMLCGMMLYDVSRIKINAMAAGSEVSKAVVNLFFMYLTFALLLSYLIAVARRRDQSRWTKTRCFGGCTAIGDFLYSYFCCPCALSWLIREERHVSSGYSHPWSMLSATGTGSEAMVDVMPVHHV